MISFGPARYSPLAASPVRRFFTVATDLLPGNWARLAASIFAITSGMRPTSYKGDFRSLRMLHEWS